MTLADRLSRPAGLARAQALVTRLGDTLGGEVRVVATDGTTLAAFGKAADRRPGTTTSTPIELDGQTVATLEADLPGPGRRPRLPARCSMPRSRSPDWSACSAIVLVSASIAGRLTRPLRDVAAAARRLEAGDASARATGGDDRESTELAEAFNAMADRLERSEMLRRRAASDIAHDLATPATVLESQLQAMIDGVVPTDIAGLEAARSAAAALGGVVADIDDLARAEAAPLQAQAGRGRPDDRDPGDRARARRSAPRPIGEPRRRRQPRARSPGRIRVTSRAPSATWSPTRSSTARSAASWRSPPRRDGSVVRIRVTDQGPGIAADDVDPRLRAFLPGRHVARDRSVDRPADRSRARADDRPRAARGERRTDRRRADGAGRHDLPARGAGGGLSPGARLRRPARLAVRPPSARGPAARAPRSAGRSGCPVISRVPRPWVTKVHAQRTRTTIRFENPIR